MNLISTRQWFCRRYWQNTLIGALLCVLSFNVCGQNRLAESTQSAEGNTTVPVVLLPMTNQSVLTPEQAIAQQAKDTMPAPVTIDGQGGQPIATSSPISTNVLASKAWSGYLAAESLAINGNPQAALQQLDARLIVAPEDAKAAYIKGMILMQLGRIDDAERWFKMMQSNFPDLPQSYNALAVIYAAKDDLYSAEETLRVLLNNHPTYQKARLNLANIYLDLAEVELKNALKEAPNDAMISNTLQSLQALRDQ